MPGKKNRSRKNKSRRKKELARRQNEEVARRQKLGVRERILEDIKKETHPLYDWPTSLVILLLDFKNEFDLFQTKFLKARVRLKNITQQLVLLEKTYNEMKNNRTGWDEKQIIAHVIKLGLCEAYGFQRTSEKDECLCDMDHLEETVSLLSKIVPLEVQTHLLKNHLAHLL